MNGWRRAETPNAEPRRGAMWVWPTAAGAIAFAAGILLARVRLPGGTWERVAWAGDADAAATMVQVVAASVITVTTLTFSLTVVALQLASQQFSPRLLRQFTRDRVTRVVLSTLVATYAVAMAVLSQLRADQPLPRAAVLVVMLSGLASLAALLGFITHIVRILRIDTMMASVHDEARAAIEAFYPRYGDHAPRQPTAGSTPPGRGDVVTASRSGFVRMVDVEGLVAGARSSDAVVQLLARPGDHVVRGTPLAVCWQREGGPPRDVEAVRSVVCEALALGYERTVEQDSAFGFRQLQDIAVKALSPGINDPVTAAHAIGYTADLLVRVVGSRLGPTVHEDDTGTARAIVADRDLPYYLDLSCGQVRRYGRHEPTVLNALLRMLRDVAVSCRDDEQRAAVAAEVQRICDAADHGMLPDESGSVGDMADRVRAALEGEVVAAYSDRAGETRSI